MDLKTLGVFLGFVFCICAVVFAVTVYMVMVQIDDNLVYMALYYEDQAHNISSWDGDINVVGYAMKQALSYCFLYEIEKRQIDFNRYRDVCGNITTIAHAYATGGMEELIEDARENLAGARARLNDSHPYMGIVFGPDFKTMQWGFSPGDMQPGAW